ncbi:Hypothetical predicted protein [Octopus vulgaris]|uniref:Uncharacterized protein n=1 Tax=Octopus vulgaris TaxID=6645 RepID=A0AA36EV66_OCTVU|nr:Hypothetical predicted protein [Octopus vulgaris]
MRLAVWRCIHYVCISSSKNQQCEIFVLVLLLERSSVFCPYSFGKTSDMQNANSFLQVKSAYISTSAFVPPIPFAHIVGDFSALLQSFFFCFTPCSLLFLGVSVLSLISFCFLPFSSLSSL